ncbi:MAG: class I SAM-dependent methyltransferase [Syntrophaceae bacterium]|nr:class I SAM-dependent methyltransferase [Syntrophaceae bacterium]
MQKQKQQYFDDLGEDFENFMNDYDVARRRHLIFNDLLKNVDLENKKILEVGSGTGKMTELIAKSTANITILDIGERLVQSTAQQYNCLGVVGDACALPFDDVSFDLVISSECIEHTLSPTQAIREMCRVCRPGGIVCITSPNKLWYPVLWLSIKTGIRHFRGIENWLFPYQAKSVMQTSQMTNIVFSGCHLWPFQIQRTQPVLKWLDNRFGRYLYLSMINYGIRGIKK